MFYSETILCQRGRLARVWLASHWEGKLSKAQFLHADIEKYVQSIMGRDSEPMALRLTSQLLLGLVRIYSRKVRYLLEDCNEAIMRIRAAFVGSLTSLGNQKPDSVADRNLIISGPQSPAHIVLPEPDFDLTALQTPRKKIKDNQTVAHSYYITLPEREINRNNIFDFDDNIKITDRSNKDSEWVLDIMEDPLKKYPPLVEVEAARDQGPLAVDFVPPIHDSILSVHQATDITLIDRKARFGGESPDYALPIETGRDNALAYQLDEDLNDLFSRFAMGRVDRNLYQTGADTIFKKNNLNEKNSSDMKKMKRRLIDRDTEISLKDLCQAFSSELSMKDILVPNSKKTAQMMEIEAIGIDYYVNGMNLAVPREIQPVINNIASRNVDYDLDIGIGNDIYLDNPMLDLGSYNKQLTPQNNKVMSVDSDPKINVEDTVWSSPQKEREICVKTLMDALENNRNGITFTSISNNQTKSFAAETFFQILSLKTKGVIDVIQDSLFGEIHVYPAS